jgi:zinc D-Ala-D-Ala carboxypeptidase
VDAIADVTQRIADIQSRLASMRPAPVSFAELMPVSSTTATTAGATGSVTGLDEATLAGAAVRPAWAGSTASGTSSSSSGSVGSTSGLSSTAGSSVAPVKTTGKVTVPEELRQYGNGKIPASALEPIGQGGHRLAAKAAAAFKEMSAAAARDGVTLKVTDSYRDYDTQVDLVRRKGLYSQGGLAAKPGTSNHGWGLAVDLNLNAQQQAWMRANGKTYGFVEDTPREPWHWGFHG